MQEVFEKIIEKLEGLRGRYGDEDFGIKGILLKTIEIVKKEAEQYNNGWIPCSERLPEEPKTNPLFEGKNVELYLVTTGYGSCEEDKVYPFRAFWNGVNFTDGWHILDVIAWQPLPEPYKQKGE